MRNRLHDKVAIVTGGGTNIGPAAARAFAAEGAAVAVADSDEDAARGVAEEITRAGGTAMPIPVDVTDSQSVRHMVDATLERYAKIDILLHAAADVQFINTQDRRLIELPETTWHHMIEMLVRPCFIGLEVARAHCGASFPQPSKPSISRRLNMSSRGPAVTRRKVS